MKFAASLVFGCALLLAACGKEDGNNLPTNPTPTQTVNVPFSTVDVRVGTGAEATNGRTATVTYTLYHYSATAADNKGAGIQTGPFSFVVGGSQTIPGFSQATLGMKVGGFRRAIVPPSLAYGANPPTGSGIGVNETLVFEIELLGVQ